MSRRSAQILGSGRTACPSGPASLAAQIGSVLSSVQAICAQLDFARPRSPTAAPAVAPIGFVFHGHPRSQPKNRRNWLCFAFCPHALPDSLPQVPNRQPRVHHPSGRRAGRLDWLCFRASTIRYFCYKSFRNRALRRTGVASNWVCFAFCPHDQHCSSVQRGLGPAGGGRGLGRWVRRVVVVWRSLGLALLVKCISYQGAARRQAETPGSSHHACPGHTGGGREGSRT
jgi:hypothetical protein